ncbi:phage tail protein [Chitinophaga sp. sic0106]|uniref:phage tail protein n=1 Tax=Chitinophaga sp. sic0106 TaxID=2854785 RepID=UPI001C43F475|nr:phage tail protein [Chitinophaga sp. sic0106]MBV7529039.1 phage tail protein [Chitinophaga sp. sic0106]
MYAQLGTTIFDGAKSFVSFSEDEEAIIVEHALIGRKARLQGTAIGLRNISITLFLHQEFCKVKDEIARLRTAKNSFEILSLLWGNGVVEGEFVITTMNIGVAQSDSIGNMVSANVNMSLKESHRENKLEQDQQAAQNNAFAVGDKKPPTKSNRVNPTPCSKQVSDIMTIIKANAGAVDTECKAYTNTSANNFKLKSHISIIQTQANKLITASLTASSCVNGVPGVNAAATSVRDKAAALLHDIQLNQTIYPHLVLPPTMPALKGHNTELQSAVRTLVSSTSPIVKNSIVKK